MLGYLLAIIVGFVLGALCFAALGGTRARPPKEERPGRGSQPAADEPTPDQSATATPSEMAEARKHTPPA